jgi:hypothetical protein
MRASGTQKEKKTTDQLERLTKMNEELRRKNISLAVTQI